VGNVENVYLFFLNHELHLCQKVREQNYAENKNQSSYPYSERRKLTASVVCFSGLGAMGSG